MDKTINFPSANSMYLPTGYLVDIPTKEDVTPASIFVFVLQDVYSMVNFRSAVLRQFMNK